MLGSSLKRRWHVIMLTLLTLAMVLPGLSSLPVIDRDEARYAQASVQMAKSGDWLNIRFQDEARNKKPAAAYWAQATMIKVFVRDGERKIWAQRLPSVLAALLAVLATYWGGLRMIGRQGAFLAAGLLAMSLIFLFEAHVAKTDALLCASTTVMFAALARLRNGGGRVEVWAFWIALGLSIMIKGPIGPTLAVLSIGGLWAWERKIGWTKPLLNWKAILVFILIWLPWAIAIFIATDGAFFIESLGNDFGGKLVSAQESHPGPPGYHSLAVWLMLWPASLFLLPGLTYAVKAVRGKRLDNGIVTRAMRLCWAWVVPFWVLIEIMPTKLPHYALPTYPALCMMIAASLLTMMQIKTFGKSRFASGLLFILASTGIIGALLYVQSLYGQSQSDMAAYIICAIGGLLALLAGFLIWRNKVKVSLTSAMLGAITLSIGAYATILPNLEQFKTPERLAAEIQKMSPTINDASIHSPDFTEPSLVYYLGTDINLDGGKIPELDGSDIIILDMARKGSKATLQNLVAETQRGGACLKMSERVDGFNYSEGDAVALVAIQQINCASSDPPALDAETDTTPDP